MSLYQTAFDADSPATNFLRGDDDGGTLQFSSKLVENVVAGTTYIMVISTYSSGITGTFTITSNPPVFSGGINNWYTAASGGPVLTTGEIFNPVGLTGSGIANTATSGTTTFYVANMLYPTCRVATTFTVASTTVSANSNSPVSVGGTINLTATSTAAIFTWAGPNSFTSNAQNPTVSSATMAAAGVYTVKINSASGSCTAMATISVSVVVPTVANVVFVNIANGSNLTQNGTTWTTAYSNLQTALINAPLDAEIWVAQGIYKPTSTADRTISFNIPNRIKLLGGFLGTETTKNQRNFNINPTILSGEIGSPSTVGDNSYHVVTFFAVSDNTVLDGFTIKDGNANLSANRIQPSPNPPISSMTVNNGGGIGLDNGSSPMIINCKIISNDAIFGGGLFATNNSNPTVRNTIFRNNQATFGGASYHLNSNPTYREILMTGNKATGAAMYNNGSNPIIINATLAGNGGLNGAIFNSNSTPVIKNSILWGNITPFNDVQSVISYSIIEGGYTGVSNLNLNPQFINLIPYGLAPTLLGDYTLTNTSPAIDAGDNGIIGLTDKDLWENSRRFNGGIVDVGAYEFQGNRIGGTLISITSGNWEAGSTWNIGRKPLAGDVVIINNNHVVTLNENGVLKNIELRPNAKILYSTAGVKLQTGY